MLLYLTSTLLIIGITDVWCHNTENSMKDACDSWGKMRQMVEKDERFVKMLCTVNNNCIGMSCTGKNGNMIGTVETYVQHCTKPVSLVVIASIPQLNYNLTHTLFDGDSVPVFQRGVGTSTDDVRMRISLQIKDDSTLLVSFSIVKNGQSIVDDIHNQIIKLPPCSELDKILVGERPLASGPLIEALKRKADTVKIDQEDESKVVLGTVTTDGKECNTEELEGCGFGETCEQTDPKSSRGICKCMANYHRDTMGNCELNPNVPSTTADPNAAAHRSDDDSGDELEIIIPIVILIVCIVSLAFFAYRYRWVPRLRSRFQQTRTYEEMVINGEDIAENHGHSLTNPTA